MHQQERYQTVKRITLFGALMNAGLGFIKLIGGILFHSHALVADGLHSFSDLLTDAMVIFATKYGGQHVDDAHPYGHQRIETAATFCLAMLLILTGAAIAWDALSELWVGDHTAPAKGALPIAALSIIINEGLFYMTRRIGHRIQSDLLIANAWHHRSDAASSLVVLAGLLGSLAGFIYLDAIAACIVGILIIQMGGSYGWNSIKELVDTAVSPEQLTEIENVIHKIDGIKKVHQLRTRSMGRDIFIDLHIQVSPSLSVSEGHFIAQNVHHQLMEQISNIKDVTVHVDPEDDETASPSLHLPNRTTLEKKFIHAWQTDYPCIQGWVIHYLEGKITIDLICTPGLNHHDLNHRIHTDLAPLSDPIHVQLLTQLDNP
jgi:cation diffusion facilitator family transporter